MTEWLVGGGVLLLLIILTGLRGRFRSRMTPALARQQFLQQREHLEARFFELAASSGKPRGLLWKDCDWSDQLEFARDRQTGTLTAIAGVSIAFDAIPGGDMEGLPAVGNLRSASALFVHDGQRWQATSRAIFNLNPAQVLAHFGGQFERLALD